MMNHLQSQNRGGPSQSTETCTEVPEKCQTSSFLSPEHRSLDLQHRDQLLAGPRRPSGRAELLSTWLLLHGNIELMLPGVLHIQPMYQCMKVLLMLLSRDRLINTYWYFYRIAGGTTAQRRKLGKKKKVIKSLEKLLHDFATHWTSYSLSLCCKILY